MRSQAKRPELALSKESFPSTAQVPLRKQLLSSSCLSLGFQFGSAWAVRCVTIQPQPLNQSVRNTTSDTPSDHKLARPLDLQRKGLGPVGSSRSQPTDLKMPGFVEASEPLGSLSSTCAS